MGLQHQESINQMGLKQKITSTDNWERHKKTVIKCHLICYRRNTTEFAFVLLRVVPRKIAELYQHLLTQEDLPGAAFQEFNFARIKLPLCT